MKITDKPVTPIVIIRKKKTTEPANPQTSPEPAKAVLSNKAHIMNKIRAAMGNETFDETKVNKIKLEISNKTYEINSSLIADKMVEQILKETT